MDSQKYDAVKIDKAAASLIKRRKTLEKLQKLAKKNEVGLENLPENVKLAINDTGLHAIFLKDALIRYRICSSEISTQNSGKAEIQSLAFDREKLARAYPEASKIFMDGYGIDELRLKCLIEGADAETVHSLEDIRSAMNSFWDLVQWVKNNKTNTKSYKTNQHIYAENLWMVSKWNSIKSDLINELLEYKFNHAAIRLIKFISGDVGTVYIRFLNGLKHDYEDQTTFLSAEYVMKQLCAYMSYFAPSISICAYYELKDRSDILTLIRPSVDRSLINKYLEDRMEKTIKLASEINSTRPSLGIPGDVPISQVILPNVTKDSIEESALKRMTSVIEIGYNINEDDFSIELNTLQLNSTYSQMEVTKIIGKFLELTKGTILRNLVNGLEISADGKKYNIPIKDVKLKPLKQNMHVINSDLSKIIINTEMNENSKREWIKKEVISSIERIREEMGIKSGSLIRFNIRFSDPYEKELDENALKEVGLAVNGELSESGRLLRIQNLNIDRYTIIISVFK